MVLSQHSYELLLYLAVCISIIVPVCSRRRCPCRVDTSKQLSDCSGASLSMIPECVPSSTVKLILDDNKIEFKLRPFRRFENLTYLSLAKTSIAMRERYPILKIPKLTYLNLFCNGLKNLTRDTFSGVAALKNLSLASNPIGDSINDFVFAELNNLIRLDLQFTNLTKLTKNTFSGLSKLKVLNLNGNKFHLAATNPIEGFELLRHLEELHFSGMCVYGDDCTYIDEQLSKLPSLKRLHVDGLPDKSLGPGFALLKNLTELYMEGYCTVRTIRIETFENLKGSLLQKLILRDCNIDYVFPYAFSGFQHLRVLDMSYNSRLCKHGLRNLTQGLDATNIRSLECKGICHDPTTIWELETGDLTEIQETKLEILDLSQCSFYYASWGLFLVFPETLKHLILNSNYFTYRYFIFRNLMYLPNLLTLDLSFQIDIPQARPKTNWCGRRTGMVIDTKYSMKNGEQKYTEFTANTSSFEIKSFESASEHKNVYKNMNKTCLKLPPRLQSLNISHSGLLYGIRLLCDSNNSLKRLDISYQNPPYQKEMLYENLRKMPLLEHLNLNGLDISFLPKDIFAKQKRLKYLSLADNQFVSVTFYVKFLTYLEVLDISGNKIQDLTKEFTAQLDTIAHTTFKIVLQKNSLICDCNRIEFLAWLSHTRYIEKKEELWCRHKNGSRLSLAYIDEIKAELEVECIAVWVIIGSVVGFVVINLILSLIYVTNYKLWKFKYLLSLGRHIVNPYHPIEDCQIDLEYDVYISYELDFQLASGTYLHEFVTQKLYPKLCQTGFRVIIREELQPGTNLYQAIAKHVRKSRNVLVFLTRNYCSDYWNVFEFNMAAIEGIYTKRQVIIPILLETLYENDLHDEILAFVSAKPIPRYSHTLHENSFIEFLSGSIR